MDCPFRFRTRTFLWESSRLEQDGDLLQKPYGKANEREYPSSHKGSLLTERGQQKDDHKLDMAASFLEEYHRSRDVRDLKSRDMLLTGTTVSAMVAGRFVKSQHSQMIHLMLTSVVILVVLL